VHVLKHALAELDEGLGDWRHADLAPNAQEQRLAELFFEKQNLTADGRLRDVQLAARRRKRSGFGDGLKNLSGEGPFRGSLLVARGSWLAR
jgi:hypothetical protein